MGLAAACRGQRGALAACCMHAANCALLRSCCGGRSLLFQPHNVMQVVHRIRIAACAEGVRGRGGCGPGRPPPAATVAAMVEGGGGTPHPIVCWGTTPARRGAGNSVSSDDPHCTACDSPVLSFEGVTQPPPVHTARPVPPSGPIRPTGSVQCNIRIMRLAKARGF